MNEHSGFSQRAMRLLERISYRRAETAQDREAIYRMRYEAYSRAGTVALRPGGIFTDPLDDEPNAWLIGVYIDGELSSSLRLHISARPESALPASPVFGDLLNPRLARGECIVDASRFVSRYEVSRAHPEIPYLTLRPSFLACEYFNADFITAACLEEHQAFYKRMWGGVPWSEPRAYPNFNRRMAFLGYDFQNERERTYGRYPFLQSQHAEQHGIFSQSSNGEDSFRAIGLETEMQLA